MYKLKATHSFFSPHFLGSVLINRFYDKNCAHNLSDWDRNHTFFPPFFFPDKNPFNSGSESKDDAVKTVTGGLGGLLSHEVRQQQSPQLYVTFVVLAFSSH